MHAVKAHFLHGWSAILIFTGTGKKISQALAVESAVLNGCKVVVWGTKNLQLFHSYIKLLLIGLSCILYECYILL